MNVFKKFQWDTSSLAFKFTVFVIALVIIQSFLLIISLIVGGVLEETEENAFQSFEEKVNFQKDYITKEMHNRWMNITPYLDELSKEISMIEHNDLIEEAYSAVTPTLISMLRTTMTNGAFIILNQAC